MVGGAAGGGGATAGGGGGATGAEDWEEQRERDTPLRQLEAVAATDGEDREGGRARAIDNQYSFF